MAHVVVFDYGSGNVRSAVRALEHVGAEVTLTGDRAAALDADGLFVPGVGNFHACLTGLRAADGPLVIETRLAGGRPVLGVCVGMQVLFDGSEEPGASPQEGLGEWPGTVTKLQADVVPHMGWSDVTAAPGSRLFAGVESERFYFVHSYAVRRWELPAGGPLRPPLVSWTTHESDPFVAAVENGPLWATQFHPEKSGDAGAVVLRQWVQQI
jgi:imidazole glycerol-phosphate synthase subunit HisH